MEQDELVSIIKGAEGGENALAYTEALLVKVNRLEAAGGYATLLKQFRTAKEEGDFRGRALEINFADCFVQQGIVLDQAVKQGTKGDIDFCWKLGEHALYLEMKLLGQDREMRDRINAQLEERGTFGVMLKCDTKDIARLRNA